MVKGNTWAQGLLYLSLGKIAPWQNKIGGPGFPKKNLWTVPSLTVTQTDVRFTGERISWAESTLSDLKKVKIEITVVDNTEGWVKFYYDGTQEASIHEEFDRTNKVLLSTFASNQDTLADLVMRLEYLESTSQFKIKFTFNSNNFESTVDIGSLDIPQCLLDVLDEIDTYNPSINVRALQSETATPFTMQVVGDGPPPGARLLFWDYVLCALGTGLSDVGTFVLTGVYGAANTAIIMA